MKRKRSPYIALLLSILLIFAYMILFLLLIFKYDFAAVFMEKFINLFKNKEIAEALFVRECEIYSVNSVGCNKKD